MSILLTYTYYTQMFDCGKYLLYSFDSFNEQIGKNTLYWSEMQPQLHFYNYLLVTSVSLGMITCHIIPGHITSLALSITHWD